MKSKIFGMSLISAVAISFGFGAPNTASGQTGGYGDGYGNVDDAGTGKQPRGITTKTGIISLTEVSKPVTRTITSRIASAAKLCKQLSSSYYADCLGERLESLAKELSTHGDYREAKKIISVASKKLRNVAASNRDSSKKRIRVSTPGSATGPTTKPISATKPEAAASVKSQAEAIIAEAQTKLLRSGNNSQRRKSHYQQIAAALGSESKVLLRSL